MRLPIFQLFWKNSSYVSGVSICIFVALSFGMCVAGANKVGGTMSWLTLWDGRLDSSQFCHLLSQLKMSRSRTFKYLHDSNFEYSDAAVQGFIFECGCWFKTFVSLFGQPQMAQRTWISCFTCFKVKYKKSYFLQVYKWNINNWYLDIRMTLT